MDYQEVKRLFLELESIGKNSHIFELSFITELLTIVQNSDLDEYKEYSSMSNEEILNTKSFEELSQKIYQEFMNNNEQNLSNFMKNNKYL